MTAYSTRILFQYSLITVFAATARTPSSPTPPHRNAQRPNSLFRSPVLEDAAADVAGAAGAGAERHEPEAVEAVSEASALSERLLAAICACSSLIFCAICCCWASPLAAPPPPIEACTEACADNGRVSLVPAAPPSMALELVVGFVSPDTV